MLEDPTLANATAAGGRGVGEAALYGVYYDDTEYDYMQHLRPMNDDANAKHGGEDEDDDTDAVWVPSAVQPKDRATKSFALKEEEEKPSLLLPASAFASKEIPLLYSSPYDVDPSVQGLQPDMDPHLRQTLEALDDEEFVEDGLDDDFFGGILQDGEWRDGASAENGWRAEAPEGDTIWLDPVHRALREKERADAEGTELSLDARIALFKHQQAQEPASGDEESEADTVEARDQLGALPPRKNRPARAPGSVSSTGSALGKPGRPGALARRAASTKAESVGGGSTVWSMSSSSMFRNKGLSDLDDQFDRVLRRYGVETGDEALDALEEECAMPDDDLDYDNVDTLTRGDFDAIMEEFLDKNEVIAGKLRQTLGDRTTTSNEKLDMIRKGLGEIRIVEDGEDVSSPAAENPFLNPDVIGADREQWDVETIQTTKTNLENHPRTIAATESVAPSMARAPTTIGAGARARVLAADDVRIPKIRIHPRTGMPQVVGYTTTRHDRASQAKARAEEQGVEAPTENALESASSSDEDEFVSQAPHKRDRNESKAQRRERKEALKQEKQARRQDKAATKHSFAEERKRQLHAAHRQQEATGGRPALHLA